ncbi:MAG: hypothetical protein GY856_33340 [bacterium]|nr:hypothetical protein [bacterium]
MERIEFRPYDEVSACLEQVLNASPADETEVVWLERRHGWATHRGPRPGFPHDGFLESPRLTVLVRVVEGSRQGLFRTDTADPNQLESGVRHALAMAKVQPGIGKRPILPTDTGELRSPPRLIDREISRLDPGSARSLLQRLCGDQEQGRLTWSEARLAIFNSHGLRRSAASSEVSLQILAGTHPGCGRAAGSARTLEALDPEGIRRRARRCHTSGPVAPFPSGPVPILLAPEATVELLNVLNAFAFAGRSYLDGTSFLSRHRNIQVFDESFNLRDDGTRGGLPFPFDFEGSAKRRLDLIVGGKPSTLALNQYQGAAAGLEPTAQAVGGQDSLFSNLFLLPGQASEAELPAAAEGGIRIGWLEPAECFEPSQLRIRAVARSVRRIEDGRLGPSLPDFVWEESLLRALARLRGVGSETIVRSTPTTPLGGISAPAIVLAETEEIVPRPVSPEAPPGQDHRPRREASPRGRRRSQRQDRRRRTTV